MEVVRLKLDYLAGPIWKNYYDPVLKRKITGVPIIDNDQFLRHMNYDTEQLYSQLYSFDDGVCTFDSEGYECIKGYLKSNVEKIVKYLDEINDGSFTVVDEIRWWRIMANGYIAVTKHSPYPICGVGDWCWHIPAEDRYGDVINKLVRLDEEHLEEERYNSLGMAGSVLFVVVTLCRADVIRLISARNASEFEKERYEYGRG